jgi:hypothetical protein
MMNKWQIGPVKLANEEEAFVDAINEGQEDWRYVGRVQYLPGLWIACGWHASGRLMHASASNPTMYADTDHKCNLAPPPKKTVRVQAWLNVDANSGWRFWHSKAHAEGWAHANRIACVPIDITVTEGDGLI